MNINFYSSESEEERYENEQWGKKNPEESHEEYYKDKYVTIKFACNSYWRKDILEYELGKFLKSSDFQDQLNGESFDTITVEVN